MLKSMKFITLAVATFFSASLMAQFDQSQLDKTVREKDQFVMGINMKACNNLKEMKNIDSQVRNSDTMFRQFAVLAEKEGITDNKFKYAYIAVNNETQSVAVRMQTDVKAQQFANFMNAIAKELKASKLTDGKLPFTVEKNGNAFNLKMSQEALQTSSTGKEQKDYLTFKDVEKGYLLFTNKARNDHKALPKNVNSPLTKLIPKNAKDFLVWGVFVNSSFKPTSDTAKEAFAQMGSPFDAVKNLIFTLKKEKEDFIIQVVNKTRDAQSAKKMKTQLDGQMMMIDMTLMKEPALAAQVKKAILVQAKKANLEITITITPSLIESISAFVQKTKEEAERATNLGDFELDDLDDSIELDSEEETNDKK